jgi:hypothetical protein
LTCSFAAQAQKKALEQNTSFLIRLYRKKRQTAFKYRWVLRIGSRISAENQKKRLKKTG